MSPSHPANIDLAAALAEAQEQYRARNPKSLAQPRGGLRRHARRQHPLRDLCRAVPADDGARRGRRLWDADGHEYVDFLGEFTAGIFGHSHPAIRRAIDARARRRLEHGRARPAEARFAKAICDRFPSIDLVRFTNCGTEANLMAVAAVRARSPAATRSWCSRAAITAACFYFRGKGSAVNAPYDFLVAPYNDIAAHPRAGRAARARTSPRS